MRIILAGIAGGILLFCWGAFSHMVLPLGEMGVKSMPNETPIMAAMKSNIADPGLYFFPGMEGGSSASDAERERWAEKYAAGPNGILIYHPTGIPPLSASYMLTELTSNILAALVVALALSMMATGFIGRIVASGMFGLVSWLSIEVSYWNWYGFPTDYTLAQAADQVGGWLVAGVAIAIFVKRRSAA